MTRAQHDPATREYLARKEAEGQTTKGALRCLKRHLARHFYHLLSLPPRPPDDDHTASEKIPPPHARDNAAIEVVGVAPMPMMCVS